MQNFTSDFSDVVFGCDDDGPWFQCDHALNFSKFITFASPIFMKLTESYFNFMEDKSDG